MDKEMKDYTDAEIVEQLVAAAKQRLPCSGPNSELVAKCTQELAEFVFDKMLSGWCCKLAKRFKRVTTQEGLSLRIFFCPRCGRKL